MWNAFDIATEDPVRHLQLYPDSKFHGANMGPIWGRQDPDGPHVGAMNFAIWVALPSPIIAPAMARFGVF